MRTRSLFPLLAVLAGLGVTPLACGGAPALRPVPPLTTAPTSSAFVPPTSSAASTTGAGPSIDREWLRTFAATRGFRFGAPQAAQPTPDGKTVLFLRGGSRSAKQSLFETDLATGATREILTADALLKEPETLSAAERARRERMRMTARGLASFELSEDGTLVLVPLSGRLFVLDRATKKTRDLATGAGFVIDPHLSPDGKHVAYVRGNDVYLAGVDGSAEVRVTRGGTDTRTHGTAEFVAQEELGRSRGFWFSPDGATIVYEEADTAKVEVLAIPDLAHPERDPYKSAYPRAGKTNADVRLGITSAGGGATKWVAWDAAKYPYVAKVTWQRGAPLTMYVLDRLQQNGALLAVDAATGKTTTLLEEHDEAWVNHDTTVPRWTPDGKQFVWSTERRGAWQLELHDAKGALVRELTKKELGYDALVDLDASAGIAVVEASEDPTDVRLYAVPLAGGEPKLLAGGAGEMAFASFGHGQHDVFVAARASRTSMPRWEARWVSAAKSPVEIPHVVESPGALPKLEYAEVGADRYRVALVRPRSFVPGRKYAVIDAAYGGPSVNVVVSNASRFLQAQWIADATDAVVVSIDARGTPHRGREWERAISGKLGSVPIDGHVAALEALGAKYPELDVPRLGVYGWSFGGYFAARAVLARPDVYKVAVAGAPVTDWRSYDTCYTERYLGLPDASVAAYDAASLLPLAKSPATGPARPLLLVHGTADDNVYFMNTLDLADALERAHRPFELLPLGGITHNPTADPELNEAMWTRSVELLRASLSASAGAGAAGGRLP